MKVLIGIDEGTSAVKASMFDLQLSQLASVRREKQTSRPAEGSSSRTRARCSRRWSTRWRHCSTRLPMRRSSPAASIIRANPCSPGNADTARPLSPVITWQDKRSQPLLDAFDEPTSARITELSGLPVDPYFSAGKVAWLLEQELPDAVCIGTVDSYLCTRLGAGFATDLSTASRTQLARLGEREWDPELCSIFGVRPGALPALRDSVGELGTLRHPRWRAELPLRAQVVDQQAALAGAGCVLPGRAKATFGTGVFVLGYLGAAVPRDAAAAGVLPTVAWSIGGDPHYALDGGVFSAGSLVDWLVDRLGLFDSPADFSQLAASVQDAGGVMVLPALSGLGAPWWRPSARAVISGLSADAGRAHVARAAIDAICHRVCDVLDAMRGFIAIDDLRIDGGLTASELLPQLLADYAQIPVELGAVDTTALGAAALAAVGAGVLSSVEDIAELVPPGREFAPRRVGDSRGAWRDFVALASSI